MRVLVCLCACVRVLVCVCACVYVRVCVRVLVCFSTACVLTVWIKCKHNRRLRSSLIRVTKMNMHHGDLNSGHGMPDMVIQLMCLWIEKEMCNSAVCACG